MSYKDYDKKLERSRQYYQEHKGEISKKWKVYYAKNRLKVLENQRLKMLKTSNKIKAREWHRNRDRRIRLKLIMDFGGKCIKCGFGDWRALQIDHINGGGNKERKNLKNTWAYTKHIMTHMGGYQLLCANCNKVKQYENKEFGDGLHKK